MFSNFSSERNNNELNGIGDEIDYRQYDDDNGNIDLGSDSEKVVQIILIILLNI